MGAATRISASAVRVEPGDWASIELTVRNTADVADRMTFEVLGDASQWSRVEPPSISLYPGAEATVDVVFTPPRLPSVPPGPTRFAVAVNPSQDPENASVEEGILLVTAFHDVSVELNPRISRGRRHAVHEVAVDNRSNIPYRPEIAAADRNLALDFNAVPGRLDVGAGTVAFAKLRVRPTRKFWRGPALTHGFEVVLNPGGGAFEGGPDLDGGGFDGSGYDGGPDFSPSEEPDFGAAEEPDFAGEADPGDDTPPTTTAPGATPPLAAPPLAAPPPLPPGADFRFAGPGPGPGPAPVGELREARQRFAPTVTADGSFVQEALVPAWLLGAVAALVALAVIVAGVWFALLRPQIQTAARTQVSRQLAAAGITSNGASPTTAPSTAAPSTVPPTSAAAPSTNAATPTPTTATPAALAGQPINGRLDGHGNGTISYTVPKGKTLQVTDLIFENPGGDTGLVELARDGTILMQVSMANFRDLDYHLVAPITLDGTQQLQLVVGSCTDVCQPGVFYSGYLENTPHQKKPANKNKQAPTTSTSTSTSAPTAG